MSLKKYSSDIAAYRLQQEVIGSRIFEAYKKLGLEKSSTDCYIILLMAYAWSRFRDFENYLWIVVVLDEDDIQLILGTIFFKFCYSWNTTRY